MLIAFLTAVFQQTQNEEVLLCTDEVRQIGIKLTRKVINATIRMK